MKIKLFLLALLVAPIFLSSFTTDVDDSKMKPNGFYINVNMPNFPGSGSNYGYAVVEVLNSEFNIVYGNVTGPTQMIDYTYPIKVSTNPDEAYVYYKTSDDLDGTVRVRVRVYNVFDQLIYSKTVSTTGNFDALNSATVTITNWGVSLP